ncbi:MAG: hypothetical protein OFPI_37590 [Osedax symbiont Rs2]|nr:MAG: hypothetical protein OFPI_37590 [Osedax symbiont Rs2]
MNNKQLAELYVELALMYEEDFPVKCGFAAATSAQTMLVEKINPGALSKTDIALIEPIFAYGHVDIHKHVTAKKRFIWF